MELARQLRARTTAGQKVLGTFITEFRTPAAAAILQRMLQVGVAQVGDQAHQAIASGQG